MLPSQAGDEREMTSHLKAVVFSCQQKAYLLPGLSLASFYLLPCPLALCRFLNMIKLIARTVTRITFLGRKQKPAHSLKKTDLAGPAADIANFFMRLI